MAQNGTQGLLEAFCPLTALAAAADEWFTAPSRSSQPDQLGLPFTRSHAGDKPAAPGSCIKGHQCSGGQATTWEGPQTFLII